MYSFVHNLCQIDLSSFNFYLIVPTHFIIDISMKNRQSWQNKTFSFAT